MKIDSSKELRVIGIIAQGSRGDIQPYIAMAVCFRKSGYEVAVLTNPNHKNFVLEFDVPCHCTTFDSEIELKENETLRKAMAAGDASFFVEAAKGFFKDYAMPECKSFLKFQEDVNPDLLLCAPTCDYFRVYANMVLNIPAIPARLQGIVYDPERVIWGLPTNLPEEQYRAMWLQIVSSFYDGFSHYDKAMMVLGKKQVMPLLTKEKYMDEMERPKCKELICQPSFFRDVLYAKAHPNHTLVGASILSSNQQKEHNHNFGGDEAEKAIENFLAADGASKPVYCGWGSMTCKSSEYMVKFAVRALMLSKQRGIVLGGWANLTLDLLRSCVTEEEEDLVSYAEKNVLFVKQAPHETIFPRVSCIVHHGGAGTTNAALRSGVPSIITPVFLDQYDHAFLVEELGVGVGFKDSQLQKLKAEDLADAIVKCLSDDRIAARAKEVGQVMRSEDGAEAVVSFVEEFWENDVRTGKFQLSIEQDLAEEKVG